MVGIVSHEQIRHGSLRRGCLQRGMRVDDAGRGKEAGIGNSPDANAAIVVGDIFQQPVDGVISVGAVIDVVVRRLIVDMRPHLDKCAFRHIAPRTSWYTKM